MGKWRTGRARTKRGTVIVTGGVCEARKVVILRRIDREGKRPWTSMSIPPYISKDILENRIKRKQFHGELDVNRSFKVVYFHAINCYCIVSFSHFLARFQTII